MEDQVNFNLKPCKFCGRTFREEILSRHQTACENLMKKKRKPFNSEQQRIQGTDIPTVRKTAQNTQKTSVRKQNWRAKHEELINSIKAARTYEISKATGKPLPPPPAPVIDPSLILCDYCGRRFNEKAAERHIPFCKEKSSRIPNRPTNIVTPKVPSKTSMKTPSSVTSQYSSPAKTKLDSRLKSPITMTDSKPIRGGYANQMKMTPPGAQKPVTTIKTTNSNKTPLKISESIRKFKTSPSGLIIPSETKSSQIEEEFPLQEELPLPPPPPAEACKRPMTGKLWTPTKSRIPVMKIRPKMPKSALNNNLFSGDFAINRSRTPSYMNEPKDRLPDISRIRMSSSGKGAAKFCHECGAGYPTHMAKFCAECGVRKIQI